ncbi:MAG: hypothetical protein SPF50_02445 [Oscillospiraceae bacterium]|nr:hypothetical protein [Oscillospiraceae bacterium]
MSSSSNDKNSVNFDFDLDSILSEFGALDEEPVSEKPFFEPSVPVMDTSKKSDQVFSAVVNDGFEASAPQDGFDFDATQIIEEFEAEDDGAESTSKLDPERIRREFESDGAPVETNEANPESAEPISSAVPDSSSELDEVDRIIAEFKHSPRPQWRIIEPEPVREEAAQSEPEPTKLREQEASLSAKTFEPPVSAAEQTKVRDEVSDDHEQEAEPELYEGSGINEETGDKYAADADYTVIEPEPPKKEKARKEPKSFRESVAVPVISALAFIAMKIKQSQVTLGETSYESEDLGEEMQPDKAARFYDKHIAGLRLRTRIAFVLCVLMAYISYGLPVPGALADAGVKSAVCLIMMISVMFCGLDIITTGIMSIVRFKLHASALIAISCLLCMIDAFLSAASVSEKVVPFCVIPALTIAFTLLGSVINARSNKIILNTAAASKHPYVVTAEAELSGGDITLVKGRKPLDGIVRRTEEDGPDESVFGVLTPYFVVAALVLSIIAAVISKDFSSFAHILSGIFVCAAPIAMLITFPMPFFISIKSLIRSGSTIAGWSGLYDIGKAKHLIVTDGDLFPKGCVKISRTRVFAGMEPERIISFAGSIISASGSAMVHPFAELMRKAGGGLMPVEAFSVHESGGLTAMIDGEDVYCGNAAFMRLMGVVLPEKYVLNNGVYIAVASVICGVFEMEYTASDAVKSALEELVGSDRHAIFAVRDFNITPSMLSVKFDMPTDGFDFPPYSERYAISGAEPSEASKPAALISREGLSALVSLADHGKMLFSRIRLSVMLSVVSAVVGMLVMFILSLSALPSVVTALSYLLAWLLITVILSFSISTP